MLTAISFIFVFGMLVFFHELGHFLLARFNKITVHEFSLGMGPKIITKQGKETLYSLRAFPIGGYVKMEGEDSTSEEEGSFSSKKPLNRLGVIAAGPIMNFVLATVLFIIIYSNMGLPINAIGGFTENSPAFNSGLVEGDEIIDINGQSIKSWESLRNGIEKSDGDIIVDIKRDNEKVENIIIKPIIEEETGRKLVGIYPLISKNLIKAIPYSIMYVSEVTKQIFNFFIMLPFGGIEGGEVVGPIGIISIVGQAAERSFLDVLFVAAYISINLGIVNLLPIPALDGGRIIFILIELVRGKPIDPEKEGFIHLVGFIALLSLMAFVIFKDVKGLF